MSRWYDGGPWWCLCRLPRRLGGLRCRRVDSVPRRRKSGLRQDSLSPAVVEPTLLRKAAMPSREKGSAIVEFVLVVPLVILVVILCFAMAGAVAAHTAVNDAALTGARSFAMTGSVHAAQDAATTEVSRSLPGAAVTTALRRSSCGAVTCAEMQLTARVTLMGGYTREVKGVAHVPAETDIQGE